jgi:GNAT superfamily N-acetyltransferase
VSDGHLTHGWEPELPGADSLLRRFVLATADRGATLAAATGGRHRRWADLAVADPASPVSFDNVAVLLAPPAYGDVHDAVRRALTFYPAERHFVLLSAWPTPDLRGAGLALMGHPPFMVRPAGGTPPASPPALEIRAVTGARERQDFLATLAEGYPLPGAEAGALARAPVAGGPLRLFVGYVDGRPVATAGAYVSQGLNDVEWVATRPAARRRGYGAALTWAATRADPAAPAVLLASDDGRPVYEAMGYVALLRLTLWHRPPTGPGGAPAGH